MEQFYQFIPSPLKRHHVVSRLRPCAATTMRVCVICDSVGRSRSWAFLPLPFWEASPTPRSNKNAPAFSSPPFRVSFSTIHPLIPLEYVITWCSFQNHVLNDFLPSWSWQVIFNHHNVPLPPRLRKIKQDKTRIFPRTVLFPRPERTLPALSVFPQLRPRPRGTKAPRESTPDPADDVSTPVSFWNSQT